MADIKEMTGCERRKNLDKIWECYRQVHRENKTDCWKELNRNALQYEKLGKQLRSGCSFACYSKNTSGCESHLARGVCLRGTIRFRWD